VRVPFAAEPTSASREPTQFVSSLLLLFNCFFWKKTCTQTYVWLGFGFEMADGIVVVTALVAAPSAKFLMGLHHHGHILHHV
jgi:hypothetical protein